MDNYSLTSKYTPSQYDNCIQFYNCKFNNNIFKTNLTGKSIKNHIVFDRQIPVERALEKEIIVNLTNKSPNQRPEKRKFESIDEVFFQKSKELSLPRKIEEGYEIIFHEGFYLKVARQFFGKSPLYNGQGKVYDSHGKLIYDGWFKEGKFFGLGTLFNSDGSFYKNCEDWYTFNGYGEWYDGRGGSYKGQLVNREPNGHGEWRDSKGIFIGNFVNGLPTGSGEWSDEKGNLYKGLYKNGYPEGQGQLTKPDEGTYLGNFVRGQPDGIGKIIDKNGVTFEVKFESGILKNCTQKTETFFQTMKNNYLIPGYHLPNVYSYPTVINNNDSIVSKYFFSPIKEI